jgi:NAD(P)-dependent dehydrogenase (short-subunit alcohol dehydrogenase family)
MDLELEGKTAIVTGGSRGIGKAIARELALEGVDVAIAARNMEALEATARELAGETGRRIVPLQADTGDGEAVKRMVVQAAEALGRIDILVNNAGLNTSNRVPTDEVSIEDWNRIVNVDLTGTFRVSRTVAARAMIPQRGGRIINIASVGGVVPFRLQSAYIAAKTGLVGFSRAMALEWGHHGVLVNAIAPGSTVTQATRGLFYGESGELNESAVELMRHIPLGRPARPDDIANAALFLAAPESSYITGHVLVVDGGWTAGYARDF